jgi:hypothetical protein
MGAERSRGGPPIFLRKPGLWGQNEAVPAGSGESRFSGDDQGRGEG